MLDFASVPPATCIKRAASPFLACYLSQIFRLFQSRLNTERNIRNLPRLHRGRSVLLEALTRFRGRLPIGRTFPALEQPTSGTTESSTISPGFIVRDRRRMAGGLLFKQVQSDDTLTHTLGDSLPRPMGWDRRCPSTRQCPIASQDSKLSNHSPQGRSELGSAYPGFPRGFAPVPGQFTPKYTTGHAACFAIASQRPFVGVVGGIGNGCL